MLLKEKMQISGDAHMSEWFIGLRRKEKILWLLFSFTCFQLVTKFPDITLIPGERTKVFSGILCLLTFLQLLIVKKNLLRLNREWSICLILSFLCLASGILSGAPGSSLWRGLTILSSGIGGFWCGRLLLVTPFHRIIFGRLCTVLLTILLALGIIGYFFYGDALYVADVHKHQLNNLLFLLSFGPLILLFKGRWAMVATGIFYLLASCYVMSLSFDPIIWFPPLLFAGAMLFGKRRKKYTVLAILFVFLVASTVHLYRVPGRFFEKDDISIWVRVENVFFSTHMAKQKPFLGIGLVAPRLEYLDDYDIVYPYVTKEQFAEVLPEVNRSSENQFLTFMCDLGFPFVLLYSFSVLLLYVKLLRYMWHREPIGGIHPAAYWVPVTATLIHLQFYDGLLHPQPSWFFHIFLGMVSITQSEALGKTSSSKQERLSSPD